MTRLIRIFIFATISLAMAASSWAQRGPSFSCKKKGSCVEVARGSYCAPIIYRCVSRKNPNQRLPAEACLRPPIRGVLKGVSRFPGMVPPKPILVSPAQNAVVDGIRGYEVVGELDQTPLAFEWQVPSLLLPVIWQYVGVVAPAMISHSEICAYLPGKKSQCDGPVGRDAKGIVKYHPRCPSLKFTAPGGGLMMGPPRFQPEFGADVNGRRAVLQLEWMVRFCNVGTCGAWSDPRKIYWVPPPILKNPVRRSAMLTQFSIEFIDKPRNETGRFHFPLLCIATPGVPCGTFEARSPSSDAYIHKGEFRYSGVGSAQWDFNPAVTAFNPNASQSGTRTVHWTAATCINVPNRPRPVCVYQTVVEAVTFQ